MSSWFKHIESLLAQVVPFETETDIGDYDLSSNVHLLAQVYEQLAGSKTEFDTLTQFRKRFQSRPVDPPAPDPNDKNLAPYRKWTSTTPEAQAREKIAWQQYHYFKAQQKYEKDQKTFAKDAAHHRHIVSTYPNSLRGYVEYMGNALGLVDQEDNAENPQNFFFAHPRSLPIRESDRRLHTYLTGGTGTGKSENIKTLVHHYLTKNTKTALVVIDPHGKLAREIAKFKENANSKRLVYIKPDLRAGIAPTLNPLELKRKTDEAITVQTEEVISVFRELIASGEGAAKFTTQMEVLLYPCIYTLIHMGGRTLQDLLKFMEPDQAGPFIDYAMRHLDNPSHLDFFERIYPQDSYNPTRLAISTRLQSIFHSHPVARFLIGNSTIDLESLVQDRSVIVFDLGDLGEMSREAIGRFVVATLQSYARRRRTGSTPIHLFIDEAHQFISPSLGRIMKESRKFGLHATLAQQIYGESMSPKMREIVSGNTAVKITARNADKSLREFASNTGTDLDLLKSLKKYEYLIQSGDSLPITYRLSTKTLGNKNAMNAEQWKAVLKDQIQRFYRPVTKPDRKTSKPLPRVPKGGAVDPNANPIGRLGRKPPVSQS